MPRLDHLSLPVHDWQNSRDWYNRPLGVAACPGISFTIQVDDVEATHRRLGAAEISFDHPPMKVFWGYGAELRIPMAIP